MSGIMYESKTALITGAAGGIGQCIARKLHSIGYQLMLVDINEPALLEMEKDLPGSAIHPANLSDSSQLESLCRDIERLTDDLALAVINAGTVTPGQLVDLSRNELDRELDVNLRSAMHLNHACARKMIAQGQGHLISTVSMGGIIALKGCATYSATKFGLRGFLTALHAELAPHGVCVSGIYPSAIDTPLLRYEACNKGSPLNFLNEPHSVEEVAQAMIKALKTNRLEIYVPYIDSVGARLVCSFPWLLSRLYPLLAYIGERGRRKFIRSRGLT